MSAGTALELLEVLWSSTPASWSTLHHLDGEHFQTTAVPTDSPRAWKAWLAEHDAGDAWFHVCPMAERPARRGDAAATSSVPALFADVDWRSAKHPRAERPKVMAAMRRLRGIIEPWP